VTLLGLSSGAFSIAALAGVRAAQGLFHRAWMASGPASRIIPSSVATGQAWDFLADLGIRPGDRAAIAAVDTAAILLAQTHICATDLGERNAPGGRTLGIVADGAVLAEHPLAAIGRGVWKDVPIVLGTTRDEAQLWFAAGLMSPTPSFEAVMREMTRFAGPAQAPALLRAYHERWTVDSPQSLRQRFLTDAVYRVPALRTARAQTMAGGAAYTYRFDWCSPIQDGALGAAHGFDEAFIWNAVERAPYAAGDPAAPALAEAMMRSVANLAHGGRPDWSPWRIEEPETAVFGGDAAFTKDDDALLDIWKGIDRR
jgi:para-nitrobenzyl esterase